MLDVVGFFELFNLVFHALIVRKEDDCGTHFVFSSLGDFGIKLLDQTGQGVVGIACKDESNGLATELSDQAVLLAVLARAFRVIDVEGVERHAPLADLWAGLQVASQHHGPADQER